MSRRPRHFRKRSRKSCVVSVCLRCRDHLNVPFRFKTLTFCDHADSREEPGVTGAGPVSQADGDTSSRFCWTETAAPEATCDPTHCRCDQETLLGHRTRWREPPDAPPRCRPRTCCPGGRELAPARLLPASAAYSPEARPVPAPRNGGPRRSTWPLRHEHSDGVSPGESCLQRYVT